MATIQPFFATAGGPSADLQAAKREWSQRLLRAAAGRGGTRAFMAAISPAPEENVVGVGIEEKLMENTPTGVACLKFLVKRKFPKDELSAKQLLPPSVNGLPTDVEEVGTLVPYAKARARARAKAARPRPKAAAAAVTLPNPRKKFRPAPPGSSVGFRDPDDQFVMAGTFCPLLQEAATPDIPIYKPRLSHQNQHPPPPPTLHPRLPPNGHPNPPPHVA